MTYFELICKAYIKENIKFESTFEIISKYISYSLSKTDGFNTYHNQAGYKYYTFGNFIPIEKEKLYKKGNIYEFVIRSLDGIFIKELSRAVRENIDNPMFLIVDTRIVEIDRYYISEIYSATPVIVSIDDGIYWTLEKDGDILKLQKQLHDNLDKKYKSFYGSELNYKANFIQFIELKNIKPQTILISKNDKKVRLFGSKFKIVPNEDETSQRLAFTALACGLGEKNSYGGGFCLGRGLRR